MNKKTIKIIFTITILMLVMFIATYSFADAGFNASDLTGNASSSANDIKDIGNRIIGVLQAIGIIVSVVMVIVLGIKYMIGSVEEKAEYKKTLMPYFIGAALIFAASTISMAVLNFLQ